MIDKTDWFSKIDLHNELTRRIAPVLNSQKLI